MAVELNLLVLCPTQTNRGSVEKDVVTMVDLAEAFDKAAIADILIALCQTDDEYKRNQLRLFFAKNRVGPKFGILPYRVSYELCKLEEQEKREHNVGAELPAWAATAVNPLQARGNQFLHHYGDAMA